MNRRRANLAIVLVSLGIILLALYAATRDARAGDATQRGAPEQTNVRPTITARPAFPGAPLGPATTLPSPEAALPSTGAPVSVPAISGEVGTALLGGWATWFDACQDCAAAGPELRAFLGDWRGQTVRVDGPDGRWVRVRLSDWCACGPRHGVPTLLDLSGAAFSELAPLSQGIVQVSIEWPQPALTLPPTDVHPDDLRMMDEVSDTLYEGGTE